jgi:transcriptional regulator with XRE-family HTH domain
MLASRSEVGDTRGMTEERDPPSYAAKVGARLRAVRKQMRLSLQAVEANSKQEFKASVLGAYERGERSISVPRLQRLARLYDVPVDQLLPRDPGDSSWDGSALGDEDEDGSYRLASGGVSGGWDDVGKVTIDLARLSQVAGPERDLLRRYIGMIQVQRQDFNGRMITMRADDVRAIACLFEMTPEALGGRLDDLGLLLRA